MKDIALCFPEIFYTPRMQEFIMQRCRDNDKQWIYSMIAGTPLKKEEVIFEMHTSWLLCKDVHQGSDFRMLVIFKDPELKTLRDLRQEHIPLLFKVKNCVRNYLLKNMPKNSHDYKIYFHYTPSVYQLHAHVVIPGQYYNNWRTHNLNHVISNIQKNTFHYRDAIIIFSMSKCIKTLNLHNVIEFEEHNKIGSEMFIVKPNNKEQNGKANFDFKQKNKNPASKMNLILNRSQQEDCHTHQDKANMKTCKYHTTARFQECMLQIKE